MVQPTLKCTKMTKIGRKLEARDYFQAYTTTLWNIFQEHYKLNKIESRHYELTLNNPFKGIQYFRK